MESHLALEGWANSISLVSGVNRGPLGAPPEGIGMDWMMGDRESKGDDDQPTYLQ
jgi:hypothetical protein